VHLLTSTHDDLSEIANSLFQALTSAVHFSMPEQIYGIPDAWILCQVGLSHFAIFPSGHFLFAKFTLLKCENT
jgi:hypothetical protein